MITDFEELSHNLTTAAAQDLRPLITEAAEALGVSEEDLGGFLANAWKAAHAGQIEIVAPGFRAGLQHQAAHDSSAEGRQRQLDE